MARRYTVLHKRLEELESVLTKVFSDSMETTLPYHQLLSDAINGKILFLKSLLSAEIDSHPQKPQHLHHILERLACLETAFHDWDESRSFPVHFPDTLGTCSCTYSYLNDDGSGTPEPVSSSPNNEEDPDPIFCFEFEEEATAAPGVMQAGPTTDVVAVDKEGERKEKGWRFRLVVECYKRIAAFGAILAVVMVMAAATATFTWEWFLHQENISPNPT